MAEALNIRALAKMAGVSTATVSLSLRNDPRIRPEVRKRIQLIATEVGYKPNPVVASLIAQVRGGKNSQRQGTLGAVFTSQNPTAAESPAIKAQIAACEARANQLGFGFDRFLLNQKAHSPENLGKVIDARGIRGLIAIGHFPGGVIPREFDFLWQQSATIVMGARPTQPALSAVAHDPFFTTVRAMHEVRRLGYQRPGLCLPPDLADVEAHRCLGGFSAEHPSSPLDSRIPIFAYQPDAEKSFRLWVKSHRPDVILTSHAKIRDWLEAMGMTAPADIGLVHLDRTTDLEGWTGMQQRHEQIGFAAVDMLTGQLSRNEFGLPPFQKCMFVYGTWIEGGTVREQVAAPSKHPRRNGKSPLVR